MRHSTARLAALAITLGLLAAPLIGGAEQVFRIGILGNVPLTDPEGSRNWGAFIQGLRDLGYVEGRNITIEHRSSEGHYERPAGRPDARAAQTNLMGRLRETIATVMRTR